MKSKKALIVGASLLMCTSSFAENENPFESKKMGASNDLKTKILLSHGVDEVDGNYNPQELNCAYGGSRFSAKGERKYLRQYKRSVRQQKRATKNKGKSDK